MARGIEAVLLSTHNLLKLGSFARIMNVGNWFELDPDKSPAVNGECLRQTKSSWERTIDAQIYGEALWTLRKCNLYVVQFETMDARVLGEWGYNRTSSGPLMFILRSSGLLYALAPTTASGPSLVCFLRHFATYRRG